MICYLEYGTGATQVHLDLAGTDFSIESIEAGAFATPSQELTQTIVRVAIQGRPNIYAATATLGDIINQVQVSEGREIGARIYFYYQPARQDYVWRARVRALAFVPTPGSGEYWKNSRFVKGELTILHNIWEGELTTVPLTNDNGADVTTGLEVDNTEDTLYTNEVLIDGDDIIGDAPAPAEIIMTNTSTDALNRIFIGHNIYSTPNNFQQVWEGEDGTVTSGSDQVDADCSDGGFKRIDVPGGAGVFGVLRWDLTANDITYSQGNQFHAILRFRTGTYGDDAYNCYYYFYFANSGSSSPIWMSQPLYLPSIPTLKSGIENIGVLRVPPWRVDESNLSQIVRLYLLAYSIDQTAQTVDLDALHLYPVDGYRDIKFLGFRNVANTERVVDDMIDGDLYHDTGVGTGRSYTAVALGTDIFLQPGKDQKLYFLTTSGAFLDFERDRTLEVIIKYRPRRLSL